MLKISIEITKDKKSRIPFDIQVPNSATVSYTHLDVYKRQTVICAAITSRMNKSKLPTHVEIDAKRYHIVKNSVVLLEQIRTIDKQRLRELVCHVDKQLMFKIDEALKVSFEPVSYTHLALCTTDGFFTIERTELINYRLLVFDFLLLFQIFL